MSNGFVERLAPHLIVGLSGPSLTDSERSILSKTPPAGVIVFSRNVASACQLRGLMYETADIILKGSGLYPLVTADHEGGRVSVLSRAIGAPPAQMAIGRTGDAALCGSVFRENARRIRSCGVNMVLAPVADINSEYLNPVIGVRSFGEDRDEVASLVREAVKALRGAGLLTCLKHFPGHGATCADSHFTLPVIGRTGEQLREMDIVPFAGGIESGADAVMTGHIAPMGGMRPASLDPGIVSTLLRGGLGFDGAVMTDAMEMGGVRTCEASIGVRGYPQAEGGRTFIRVLRLALEAGNDILLFSGPVEELFQDIESIPAQLEGEDDFWHERFDTVSSGALNRIARLRRAAGLMEGERTGSLRAGAVDFPGEASLEGGSRPGEEVYREVARRSVNILRDRASLLSHGGVGDMSLKFCGERDDFRNEVVGEFIARVAARTCKDSRIKGAGSDLGDALVAPDSLESGLERTFPGGDEKKELVELSPGIEAGGGADVIFLLNRRPLSRKTVSRLCSDADIVVVAGWPYAAHYVHPDKTVVVTYGIYDAAAGAVCDILGR